MIIVGVGIAFVTSDPQMAEAGFWDWIREAFKRAPPIIIGAW